ncbi:HEAT repeat domain-containing protein [Aliikangiella coralliicola]|uniref:HEAT repeat domain-containing protein n=1 Tax=Aliikangiella coralliicola TaxID=2592383 RepID=A0A545UIS0_9GAMM|nr:HEAT repeat domain-containing protein [Aliikangiella coralliicola]TQV89360.1 HEAT repeat domain-containing protein [Aliikangiella coralliicola]
MKLLIKTIMTLAVVSVSFSVIALATHLSNGEIRKVNAEKSIEKTIEAQDIKGDTWFTYQVEMEPNNGMPCCYRGDEQRGCSLERRANSWGSTHDHYEDSKVLNIYFRWKNNKPTELFYAGSECAVDAGGKVVYQLDGVDAKQSVRFLSSYVDDTNKKVKRRFVDKVVAGIALHKGDIAHRQLDQFSRSDKRKLSHNAIFWLGEARNTAGYESLVKILEDDERSVKSRSKAIFALSLNSDERAVDRLVEYAKNNSNKKIQGEAIFWLSQSFKSEALEVIRDIFSSDASNHVKKKAVFALSQIDTDASWEQLVQLAKGDANPRVRKEAIFWLSQNHKREAKSVLLEIIRGDSSRSIKEKAVFAISQLSGKEAISGLIEVIKTANNKSIKKKALFWLGQSDDPEALALIEEILTASVD